MTHSPYLVTERERDRLRHLGQEHLISKLYGIRGRLHERNRWKYNDATVAALQADDDQIVAIIRGDAK